jgi:hypothetical protein
MTRIEALAAIVKAPRDHEHQRRIGYRWIYAPESTVRHPLTARVRSLHQWIKLYDTQRTSA